jgi:hypothetical protein
MKIFLGGGTVLIGYIIGSMLEFSVYCNESFDSPLGTVRPIYRTGTPLPSKHPILCIFSTNIRTEFF